MSSPDDRRRYVAENILSGLDLRPFIGGEYVDAATDDMRRVIDPYTNATLVEMPDCSPQDVSRAVGAAREAFDDGRWSRLTPDKRATCLLQLADLIDQHHDDLALLESSDVGKPISGTTGWDISNAATIYRYYAHLVKEAVGDINIPGSQRAYQHREPLGVVAALVPWNFPFPCISWKIGPALAAGCCVVIKSAERAPLSAQMLARLAFDAGFPPGVVNVVMGAGPSAGASLVADDRVDAISFTGGAATASALVEGSARHLPRLTLELGGKGANVVWSDADFDQAVAGTVVGMFDVAGQNCCASSRTIVHEDIAEAFIEAVVQATGERQLGDPLDDSTQQGPQIDAAHVQHIHRFVVEAKEQGATILTGGGTPPELGGNFYSPTVIDGVNHDMRISREEIFGPVGCIYRASDLDSAIQQANRTSFGLSSSVWASDPDVLDRFVRESRVGVCWVNTFGLFDPEVPWGGTKRSGYGRELGHEALREFTTPKTVYWER